MGALLPVGSWLLLRCPVQAATPSRLASRPISSQRGEGLASLRRHQLGGIGMRRKAVVGTLAGVLAISAGSMVGLSSGMAQPAAAGGPVDLATESDVRVFGVGPANYMDTAVNIGDANGDGLADFAFGANNFSTRDRMGAGAVYVVYGSNPQSAIDLSNLSGTGYTIYGPQMYSRIGSELAPVGDFNGDGFADFVISARQGDSSAYQGGVVYLILGGPRSTDVDLKSPGGAAISVGSRVYDDECSTIAGVGDFNGDSLSDLAVGCGGSSANDWRAAGRAYVIFGSRAPSNVDLSTSLPPTAGVQVSGDAPSARIGGAMSSAGDVNGDGLGDLLLGQPNFSTPTKLKVGAAYVVLGSRSPSSLTLPEGEWSISPSQAVRIIGAETQAGLGATLAGVGDTNGDSRADIAVSSGQNVIVLLGSREPRSMDLSRESLNVPTGVGWAIDGAGSGIGSERFVIASGQDFNSDGLSDVALAFYRAAYLGRTAAGAAWVVYGSRDLQLRTISGDGSVRVPASGRRGGVLFQGAAAWNQLSKANGIGDFNHDGVTDLAMGAPTTDEGRLSLENRGTVFIQFGFKPSAPGAPTGARAVSGPAKATVTWTAPAAGDVDMYRVTASPGGLTCETAALSCTVEGLTNGTSYTFTVVALNSSGPSQPSSPTNAVVPSGQSGPPGAVTLLRAKPLKGGALLSWASPADATGAVSYEYRVGKGSSKSTSGTSVRIQGLAKAKAVVVSVRAKNAAGAGPWSSVRVTPS
jgi:hypothetical protein